jgi:GNAT superfamily N-acetyltransferase
MSAPVRRPANRGRAAVRRLPRDLQTRPPVFADAAALLSLVAACERTFRDWAPACWTFPEVPPDWPRRVTAPGGWARCALDRVGAIVAFASFRSATRDEAPGPAGAGAHVDALYVLPARWREGIAAAMLAYAEAAMRARGYGAAGLWTPEGAPAERFYAAQGWHRDGRAGWHPWLGLYMVGYAKRL